MIGIEIAYIKFGKLTSEDPLRKITQEMSPQTSSGLANIGYSFKNGIRPYALIGMGLVQLNQNNPIYIPSAKAVGAGLGIEFAPEKLAGFGVKASWTGYWFSVDYTAYSNKSEFYNVYSDRILLGQFNLGLSYKI